MNHQIAERMALLHGESAFTIMAKANELEAQGKHIIHLEIGQPDFKTPQNIIDACCRALDEGKTGYTPTAGILPLREAIAQHCMRHKNVVTNPDEIVVVPGGKPIMFYTMLALVNPGDEVIYPNPGFPIYESCIKFAGGTPIPMPLLEEKGFSLDLDALKRSITDKTKLIILNNPGNPTGGVIPKEDILAIADIIRDKNIYVMSDEIYDQMVFEGTPFSIASLPEMKDRTIILDGFSKAYAMTGWRLGYGVMPKEIAAHITMLMVNSNSCAASMTQWAAIEALNGPQDSSRAMVAAFRERRDYIVNALNQIDGIRCAMPKGAFYAFPNISSFGLSSNEFADRLLTEGGVAAASGTAFGAYGEGYIRLSYANSMENLKIAVERIIAFTRTL